MLDTQIRLLKGHKKVSSTHQLPYPSIMRGGVFFCLYFCHNNLMNIPQNIFNDHYEEIIYLLRPRQSVIENIDKMLNCGDPSFGGAMYGCTNCGTMKFVPFRCKSRFCPTCGNKYSIDRTNSMSFKIIRVHRVIKPDYKKYILRRSYWRNNIFISFGDDPLKCPNCGETMSFQELRYNHKHISLEEMYNKAMAKARAPA